MSKINDLLKKVGDGSLDAKKAGEQIKGLIKTKPKPSAKDTLTSMVSDENWYEYEDTFTEVSGAWASGLISDSQYYTIYEIVTEGMDAGKKK